MNLYDFLYDFRRGIGDMGYSEYLTVGYLNEGGLAEIARRRQLLVEFEDKRSWSSVAYQSRYALPALHTHRDMAVRFDNNALKPKDKAAMELLGDGARYSETSQPDFYAVSNGYLELWPVPNRGAGTVNLNANATASSTAFTVDSVSGLKLQGRGVIDSEVFSWTHVDSTNLQLTGLERGLEGTRPAAHSSGSAVAERNIEWFGGLLPARFFASPSRSAKAALVTNGSACTDGEHRVFISFFSQKWASESLLTEVGSVTVTGNGQIDVTNLPVSDQVDVSHIRIYMTTAGGGTKYYVTELAVGSDTYSITTDDSTLATNSIYSIFEGDVPIQYQGAIVNFALAKWFLDNEQYARWRERLAAAAQIVDGWFLDIELQRTGDVINY